MKLLPHLKQHTFELKYTEIKETKTLADALGVVPEQGFPPRNTENFLFVF